MAHEIPIPPHRIPSVDVLIVTFNSADVILECLDSIERHRPLPAEGQVSIHVYDNASTDATVQMVTSHFPDVRVRRSLVNTGFAAASNTLVAESDADYVMLLNPDTVWPSDLIMPLLTALRAHAGAVIAAPELVYPDGRPQLSTLAFPTLASEWYRAIRHSKLSRVPLIGRPRLPRMSTTTSASAHPGTAFFALFSWATCWLIDATWVREHGLFDTRFSQYDEDLDLCVRLHRSGKRVLYVPDVTLIHSGGGSSTPAAKRRLVQAARSRYFRIHHGVLASLVYSRLIVPIDDARTHE
jgi:GT2 family glycosyltransferase